MTDEQCAAVRLVLAAHRATAEEQRTATIVDAMSEKQGDAYDQALDVAVNANRKARKARDMVTNEHIATLDDMLGECW